MKDVSIVLCPFENNDFFGMVDLVDIDASASRDNPQSYDERSN
jgi:hypothetical protein